LVDNVPNLTIATCKILIQKGTPISLLLFFTIILLEQYQDSRDTKLQWLQPDEVQMKEKVALNFFKWHDDAEGVIANDLGKAASCLYFWMVQTLSANDSAGTPSAVVNQVYLLLGKCSPNNCYLGVNVLPNFVRVICFLEVLRINLSTICISNRYELRRFWMVTLAKLFCHLFCFKQIWIHHCGDYFSLGKPSGNRVICFVYKPLR